MRPGQTFLCEACALRFERAERCPECGGRVFDLSDANARRDVLPRLSRATWGWRVREWLTPSPGCVVGVIVTGIIVATLAAMVAGTLLLESKWLALGAYVAVPVVLTVIWTVFFPDLHERFREPELVTVDIPIRLRAPPSTDAPEQRQRLLGRVGEAEELLVSPLAGERCVAYRLVGSSGRMRIDEGDAVPFVLETESGPIEVDPRPATLMLRTPDPAPIGELPERLRDFLAERGVTAKREDVTLSEARVQVGDTIVVESNVLTVQRPDGYRNMREAKLLKEQDGSPLIIERAKSQR